MAIEEHLNRSEADVSEELSASSILTIAHDMYGIPEKEITISKIKSGYPYKITIEHTVDNEELKKSFYMKKSDRGAMFMMEGIGYEMFNRFTDHHLDYTYSDSFFACDGIKGWLLTPTNRSLGQFSKDYCYQMGKALGYAKAFQLSDRKWNNMIIDGNLEIKNIDLCEIFCGTEYLFEFSPKWKKAYHQGGKDADRIITEKLNEEKETAIPFIEEAAKYKTNKMSDLKLFWKDPKDLLKRLE